MRQLPTAAGIAAAVALALAAAAQGATGTVSLGQRQGNFTFTSPRFPAAVNTTSTGTTTTTNSSTTTSTPQNVQTTDTSTQANRAATAGTFTSGSTSALGPLPSTPGAIATIETGTTTTGTATGTTTGSSSTGASLGAFTPLGANFGALGTGAVNAPIFGSADVTGAMAAPASNATLASTTPTFTNADIYAGASLAQNGIAVTEAQANGRNVDRAIAQVSRDRKRVGRNGQLLYSLAPRTNVDRTAQMPDDPLPPSLTGSNSTLTR